jgi:hypothetical protein
MRIAALGSATPAQTAEMKEAEKRLTAKNAEYKDENEKILKEAEEFRKESVKEQSGAHHSAKAGDRYNKAEIFLQVGVVFCSITLPTQKRWGSRTGIGLADVGIGLAVSVFMM